MTIIYDKYKDMTLDEMVDFIHNIDKAIWEGVKKVLLKKEY